jgi:hypothetical protein
MKPREGYEHPKKGEIVQEDWLKIVQGKVQPVAAYLVGYQIAFPDAWLKPKQEPTK